MIALPDDDTPRVEWITRVTYPPEHPAQVAGTTQDMCAGSNRGLAVHRRTWHTANGATAVVMKRTWTPSPWEEDNDDA